MGQWVFQELRPGDIRREPNEAILFKTEHVGENEYAGTDTFAREILQNAVDARDGNPPVRVRFTFLNSDQAPSRERLSQYFARLRNPLEKRGFSFDNDGVPELPCRFLVCEDFGTRGLEGDTQLCHDPPPDHTRREDFFWFWRNIGRSAKTGDDLGRWGLGKTVYRAASQAGCMFGLTVRKSDGQRYLMGQAVLSIHTWDNKEYLPEGHWCNLEPKTGVPLPIQDPYELDRFCKEWHINRQNEPGLSVVVPFIPNELQAKPLIQAVAVHFLTLILRGELVVEVYDQETDHVVLDQSNLETVCKTIEWNGPKPTKRNAPPPIQFFRRSLETRDFVSTRVLGEKNLPELNDQAFEEADLKLARQEFSSGEKVSVRVNLRLPRKKGYGPDQQGYADVHLQRLSDGMPGQCYFVREGMTITKISSSSANRGIQSFVNVDTGPLAKLLGDTEGPAHEDWDTSSERPDREWSKWKGRVLFVRKIVDRLVEVLNPPISRPDFDLLSDFFSIEHTRGSQRQKKMGNEQPGRGALPPIPSEEKWFHLTQRVGGFTITRNSRVPIPNNAILKVAIAYDIPRGDPLRSWNPIDFIISDKPGDLRPEGTGLKVYRNQRNILTLREFMDEFSISISGFDPHRDLFIRIDERTETQEGRS